MVEKRGLLRLPVNGEEIAVPSAPETREYELEDLAANDLVLYFAQAMARTRACHLELGLGCTVTRWGHRATRAPGGARRPRRTPRRP